MKILLLSLIWKNKYFNNFDFNLFDKRNKKRFILIFYILKEKKLLKLEFFNIIKIDINFYYYLIRNKNNKLFSIIINEIYNNLSLKLII